MLHSIRVRNSIATSIGFIFADLLKNPSAHWVLKSTSHKIFIIFGHRYAMRLLKVEQSVIGLGKSTAAIEEHRIIERNCGVLTTKSIKK